MAPLQVDPHAYLKPHHSAGRCLLGADDPLAMRSRDLLDPALGERQVGRRQLTGDDASLSPPFGVKVGHSVGASHRIFC